MAEPQPLFDYTGHLPECPTWSEAEQALYWADIMECEIHRYDVQTGDHQVLQFPEDARLVLHYDEKGRFYRRLYVAVSGSPMFMDYCRRKVCD